MVRSNASYDPEADAAYIALVDSIQPGEVSRTVDLEPTELGMPMLVDFDANGRVVGIEVLQASKYLRI